MGCFDYQCECDGKTCGHVGGQLNSSNVIVEVPLSDGTVVYLKGEYEEYGYVVVENYKFYPEQFREFFVSWFDGEPEKERASSFLAKRIWTESETTWTTDKFGSNIEGFVERRCFDYVGAKISDITDDTVRKCIRADKGLVLESEDEKKQKRIAYLKSQVEMMQKEIARISRP